MGGFLMLVKLSEGGSVRIHSLKQVLIDVVLTVVYIFAMHTLIQTDRHRRWFSALRDIKSALKLARNL